MQKTIEKILFRVAGVTKYKKGVKEACNLIAEDNGIPEYAKYYSNLSTTELREELEEYGLKVFKYQDLDFFNIELVPEVDNKYDPNAIKVLIFNNHVGYVPATIAKTIEATLKKETPTIKSIVLSIVGILFLLSSLSLLLEGKIGPFFIGLIISYILIRPIIKYLKK